MVDEKRLTEFGMLTDVSLRAAWPNEAHDFTPWLADNLGRLSEVIGVPLETETTEAPVGEFAGDILATGPDGQSVLIENQLEASDHSHLGQIMTYLAGLDARIVVWITRDFTEPHLSAIQWLNRHTDDEFSFFAVRLRVVRITDSLWLQSSRSLRSLTDGSGRCVAKAPGRERKTSRHTASSGRATSGGTQAMASGPITAWPTSGSAHAGTHRRFRWHSRSLRVVSASSSRREDSRRRRWTSG